MKKRRIILGAAAVLLLQRLDRRCEYQGSEVVRHCILLRPGPACSGRPEGFNTLRPFALSFRRKCSMRLAISSPCVSGAKWPYPVDAFRGALDPAMWSRPPVEKKWLAKPLG